jgi:hypothetical protein
VGELTATEANADLDLVPFTEEFTDELALRLKIVFFYLGLHPDFLHLDDILVSLGVPHALLLLIPVLAEVENFADRGVGVRGYLHQVQAYALSERHGIEGAHDPSLVALCVNDEHFSCTNLSIDPQILCSQTISLCFR